MCLPAVRRAPLVCVGNGWPGADGATHGSNVRDVEPAAFIVAFAEHLKKSGTFKVPEWADYIKTARKCRGFGEAWAGAPCGQMARWGGSSKGCSGFVYTGSPCASRTAYLPATEHNKLLCSTATAVRLHLHWHCVWVHVVHKTASGRAVAWGLPPPPLYPPTLPR